MSISVLDASQFLHGSPSQRAEFADKLLKSCIEHGFVKLINHGMPDAVITEMFSWARKFFDLPLATREKMENQSKGAPQRGWSCVGAERTSKLYEARINGSVTDGEALIDAREHFDQGSPNDHTFPNRWPDEDELPGFRAFMEQYYILFRNVSLFLLSAFETAYHLPPQTLTSKVSHDASEVRINHYTDIDIADIRKGGVTRISPHTDLGVITCLFQDGSGGLEMEDREHKGEFIPIPSDSPFEMIVNISETFQRWTNDKLPAGVHQVTIPQHMKHLDKGIIPSRYSSACFVKANRDAMVGPLSEFVSEKEPAVYDYISALEYHQRRITSAYLRQA